ncbi:MAG: hypothetical protein ACT4ON_03885 [Bacteroidota bacterium]
MKCKILFLTIIAIFIGNKSFGQLMTFGFIKNCMSYERTTVTDELKKKQFFVADRSKDIVNNKLLEGATYYSNNKEDLTKGEIGVLSQISGSKKIVEISFANGKTDYSKNYTEVHNQMISFFNTETTFKSPKYKTDVLKYSKDKSYYYVFKANNIPTIVIANYKIDEDYFEFTK